MLPIVEDYPCSYAALIIIDAEAGIKWRYWNDCGDDRHWLLSPSGNALATDIEARVRSLVAAADPSRRLSAVVMHEAGKTLRLSRLDGGEELFALVLESDRNDAKMTRAVSKYQLTKRQTEVLALLLDGASANDVARALVISGYTAQGYVKCLLTKTASRNRAEMVAKVLDWTPRAATPSVSPAKALARMAV